MKAVFQTRVDEKTGDCQRAVFASMLELDAMQVPNFSMFPQTVWWHVLYYFLYALGWELEGCMNPPVDDLFNRRLDVCGIDGYHYASVFSKTFGAGVSHAVVMDRQGNVAHDPSPNQLWAGKNLFDEGLLCVYLIKKRKDRSTLESPERR